jgi:hypothetical protein
MLIQFANQTHSVGYKIHIKKSEMREKAKRRKELKAYRRRGRSVE